MAPEEIRTGMKVRVNEDISLTNQLWSTDYSMRAMAGSDRGYSVAKVQELTPRVGLNNHWAAEVNGYWFAVEDLRYYEPADHEEVQLVQGSKVKFDPAMI